MSEIRWVFFKVTLRRDSPFKDRQEILVSRFLNADTYERKIRGTAYRYQFYDVEKLIVEKVTHVIGYITRSPMLARGRMLNEKTRRSNEGVVNVPELADYSEFIYDTESCVLALHLRPPFSSLPGTARAFRQLLGIPYERNSAQLDVRADILRDPKFVDEQFEGAGDLSQVSLRYVKPNPTGDDGLDKIHLALIGEEIDADDVDFDASKHDGSLDKSRDGFIRRSIRFLLNRGYLKRGRLRFVDDIVDLLDSREKIRTTPGYSKDGNNEPKGLRVWAKEWLAALRENTDIYG